MLLISGTVEHAPAGIFLLCKPFSTTALLQAVARALGRSTTAGC